MDETQRRERHYFEMFRKDYPLPSASVCYGDKPDVILRGDSTIGIEITNFFLEPGHSVGSEQRQRSKRNTVIIEAQNIFQETTKRNVEFTFQFDPSHPITDVPRLAKTIASLAVSLSERNTGNIPNELFNSVPELKSLYLNAREWESATWRLAQVFSVPVISIDSLKTIIASKEAKAKSYRMCDAYWLLIIVDFMDRAQDQEIFSERLENISSRIFERIILYKTVFGHVVELGARTQ